MFRLDSVITLLCALERAAQNTFASALAKPGNIFWSRGPHTKSSTMKICTLTPNEIQSDFDREFQLDLIRNYPHDLVIGSYVSYDQIDPILLFSEDNTTMRVRDQIMPINSAMLHTLSFFDLHPANWSAWIKQSMRTASGLSNRDVVNGFNELLRDLIDTKPGLSLTSKYVLNKVISGWRVVDVDRVKVCVELDETELRNVNTFVVQQDDASSAVIAFLITMTQQMLNVIATKLEHLLYSSHWAHSGRLAFLKDVRKGVRTALWARAHRSLHNVGTALWAMSPASLKLLHDERGAKRSAVQVLRDDIYQIIGVLHQLNVLEMIYEWRFVDKMMHTDIFLVQIRDSVLDQFLPKLDFNQSDIERMTVKRNAPVIRINELYVPSELTGFDLFLDTDYGVRSRKPSTATRRFSRGASHHSDSASDNSDSTVIDFETGL